MTYPGTAAVDHTRAAAWYARQTEMAAREAELDRLRALFIGSETDDETEEDA